MKRCEDTKVGCRVGGELVCPGCVTEKEYEMLRDSDFITQTEAKALREEAYCSRCFKHFLVH